VLFDEHQDPGHGEGDAKNCPNVKTVHNSLSLALIGVIPHAPRLNKPLSKLEEGTLHFIVIA
jgi:hypothetical protein